MSIQRAGSVLAFAGLFATALFACSTEVDGKNKALERIDPGKGTVGADSGSKAKSSGAGEAPRSSDSDKAHTRETIKESYKEVTTLVERAGMGAAGSQVAGIEPKVAAILATDSPAAARAQVLVLAKQLGGDLKDAGALPEGGAALAAKTDEMITKLLNGRSLASLSKEEAKLLFESAILSALKELAAGGSKPDQPSDGGGLPISTAPPVVATPNVSGTAESAVPSSPVSHLMVRNRTTFGLEVWAIDSLGRVSKRAPLMLEGAGVDARPLTGPGWGYAGSGDLDGDGHPDLFMRRQDAAPNTEQSFMVLYTRGLKVVRSKVLLPNVHPDWHAFGVGDANRDGIPDIYWRNRSNGSLRMSLLARDGTVQPVPLKNADGSDAVNAAWADSGPWRALDVVDFDGDGKESVVWINVTSGKMLTWEMNVSKVEGHVTLSNDPLLAGNATYQYAGSLDVAGEPKKRMVIQYRNVNSSDADRGQLRLTALGDSSRVILGEAMKDLSFVPLKGTRIVIP